MRTWILALVACSAPPKPPPVANHAAPDEDLDAQLIAHVRANLHVPPAAIEEAVGQHAIINTALQPREILDRVELVPDPAHADEPLARHRAQTIIYWRRPVHDDDSDPHIVGVQIWDDGTARVFFALVLPP